MIRPLEEQFERDTVRRIRTLINAFEEIDLPSGPVRYMASEVRRCLEAGLLLAAVQVSAALFERFVRKLVILERVKDQPRRASTSLADLLDRAENEIEADRHLNVPHLIDELEQLTLLDDADAAAARAYYRDVAIPLQHALTGRYIRAQHVDGRKSVQDELGLSHCVQFFEFENTIEDHALEHLGVVVNFIAKYSPLCNRMLAAEAVDED